LILLAISRCLIVHSGTNALANTDIFYGQNSLESLVEGNKVIIPLSGGARVGVENERVTYVISDHTGSARVVVGKDNTVSEQVEYTPFGDTPSVGGSSEVGHYTGQTFEPEVGTYDYHARVYEPAAGRFIGPDIRREDASPYVYTGNNPINYVDPTGGGKISFLFFSGYDFYSQYPDISSGVAASEEGRITEIEKINDAGLKVMTSMLEGVERIYLKPGDSVDHIMIKAHGTLDGKIALVDTTGGLNKLRGNQFVSYLFDTMNSRYPEGIDTVKRISLMSCLLGCQGENSFLRDFTNSAERFFPNLKEVYGSPYSFGVTRSTDEKRVQFGIFGIPDTPPDDTVRFHFVDNEQKIVNYVSAEMKMKEFYSGKISKKFFREPSSNNLRYVATVREPIPTAGFVNNEMADIMKKKSTIRSYLSRFKSDFDQPLFTKMSVVRDIYTPRPKTRSVDIPRP